MLLPLPTNDRVVWHDSWTIVNVSKHYCLRVQNSKWWWRRTYVSFFKRYERLLVTPVDRALEELNWTKSRWWAPQRTRSVTKRSSTAIGRKSIRCVTKNIGRRHGKCGCRSVLLPRSCRWRGDQGGVCVYDSPHMTCHVRSFAYTADLCICICWDWVAPQFQCVVLLLLLKHMLTTNFSPCLLFLSLPMCTFTGPTDLAEHYFTHTRIIPALSSCTFR